MELKSKINRDLRKIIKKDYGKEISEEHADTLGLSLLRLARLAVTALARKEKLKK